MNRGQRRKLLSQIMPRTETREAVQERMLHILGPRILGHAIGDKRINLRANVTTIAGRAVAREVFN